MSPKTFTGFRGYATLMEIGGYKFIVMANSPLALSQLHQAILPNAAEPFNPAMCQKVVMIESKILSETKP